MGVSSSVSKALQKGSGVSSIRKDVFWTNCPVCESISYLQENHKRRHNVFKKMLDGSRINILNLTVHRTEIRCTSQNDTPIASSESIKWWKSSDLANLSFLWLPLNSIITSSQTKRTSLTTARSSSLLKHTDSESWWIQRCQIIQTDVNLFFF